ncbi:hypothetical protein CROQUDRAFT_36660 [Cronartium quercuum f. sp. fusiforme G11]|uniref:Acetyl-CoA synthetase-like protein n=1 Tax=Cronartium quercuum f. sp. fusiforme G11 TaxID=708437 RepID=A0A9P6NSU8_9BASI|nr:hypothetical protein CROQUDRAFT_36660 [Cronartium quercuum f. sp. fusiforme G11]
MLPEFKKPDLTTPNLSPEKLLDFHILNNPSYPYGVLAAHENSSNEVITWNEVGNALINITRELNLAAQTQAAATPIVGIFTASESLVYFTLVLAIMRAGCVPFPISPRNSSAAVVHLLKSTGCKTLYVQFDPTLPIHDLETLPVGEQLSRKQIKEILELLPDSFRLNLLEFPAAYTLFPRLANGSAYKPQLDLPQQLARIVTPDRPAWAPVLIVHSSGTTAFPKPIYINRLSFHAWLTAPLCSEFPWQGQLISAMILPAFHAMGIHYGVVINLSAGTISGLFRPEVGSDGRAITKSPNAVNVMEAMRSLGCAVTIVSPFMLAEFASDPSNIEFLRTMKRVGFGGGPMDVGIGNKLVREGVKLAVLYGSTEVGPVSALFPDPYSGENWEYFKISPHLVTRLIPQDEAEGLYELVVLSSATHRCSLAQLETSFEPQTYHTNDIVYKHPTLPLYRVVGRIDDQIILSTSEKTNPGPMEAIMVFNPAIKGALMFGRGKPANGVIIEPEDGFLVDVMDREAVDRYIDLIWPSIEEANKFAPSHSRLTRDLIMVIDPRVTPLPKTSKGQIARVKTLEILAKQIEEIYSRDELAVDKILASMNVRDGSGNVMRESVLAYIQRIVKITLESNPNTDQDLFSQGCDSLAAKHIRSRIIQLFESASDTTPDVPQNIVYQHPTVSGLSEWVFNKLAHVKFHQEPDSDPCVPLREMVKKYSPQVRIDVKSRRSSWRATEYLNSKLKKVGNMTLAKHIFN